MKNIDKLINLINKENLFPNLSEDNFEEFFEIYLLSYDITEIDEAFICLQSIKKREINHVFMIQ
ncbi:MAG: hypothetical protein IKC49_03005, partial [Clostridia bacterium]|nr:hypothetical protein [Clostridia bacterium]